MLLEIFTKLTSESLLSLYPVFVKNIGLPLHIQTWSRLFSYVIISTFFIDYGFVTKMIMSSKGILLSFVTLAHIYTSYRGFQLLESGVAYSIFYLYPIMILLMSGYNISPVMGLALLGVYLLSSDDKESFFKSEESEEKYNHEGLIMILLAGFTEAIIYFLVKDIKTFNNWNHIFISYFPALMVLSYLLQTDIYSYLTQKNALNTPMSWSIFINSTIGLLGYLLRFFAVSRLDTLLYAVLSYFGIVMSFLYGILLNGETISLKKIAGALMIIFANFALL
jgi:drug/metabolite transporter (DMT)-like permease